MSGVRKRDVNIFYSTLSTPVVWPPENCTQNTAVNILPSIYNVHVLLLTQDGDKFWRMPECFIRGSMIKYLRIPDEVCHCLLVIQDILSLPTCCYSMYVVSH